jgi:hypothetical protein
VGSAVEGAWVPDAEVIRLLLDDLAVIDVPAQIKVRGSAVASWIIDILFLSFEQVDLTFLAEGAVFLRVAAEVEATE